jgi:2-aminoadipate transaminase
VNHTAALTMAVFGAGGGYDAHLTAVRAAYRTQRDALIAALRHHLPAVPVPVPGGGWFVWLPLPAGIDATTLLPHAERNGTSFVPGPRFFADGTGGTDRLRLSFSLLPPDDLADAASRLATAIHPLLPP